MTVFELALAQRLVEVRREIDAACVDAGRNPAEVELLAVSKLKSTDDIRTAFLAGQRSFGENYAQEFIEKQVILQELPDIAWHFIGHLQTNKAKLIVGRAAIIQSLDSLKLAARISSLAVRQNLVQNVLIEVKLGNEENKSGVPYEQVEDLCGKITNMSGIALQGLMGIAPLPSYQDSGGPERHFSELRDLFDRLPPDNKKVLSMGMSSDFAAAIAAGSTMVRIGTALFGRR